MSLQRIVVFDLETVPDVKAARVMLGFGEDRTDLEVRQALGERYAREGQDPALAFVKTPMHKLACIGALYAERESRGAPWTLTGFGAAHTGLRTEAELVASFVDSLAAAPTPQLIGFNSSGFDLPVLRYRALALSVPVPVLLGKNGRDYWYRFGKDHLDLCDVISGYGASPRPSLTEVAALCGVPVKVGGTDGSAVETMVLEGRIAEVAAYCETDVVATYMILLRYWLLNGEVEPEAYRLSLQSLAAALGERVPKRPHLEPYVLALRASEATPDLKGNVVDGSGQVSA